jgi:hypothetical protein
MPASDDRAWLLRPTRRVHCVMLRLRCDTVLRTGERVSISTSRDVIVQQEPVLEPAPDADPVAARPASALFRLRSAQPSRRAVVHLQAAGDPVVPADLAAWFTERCCHFYLCGLRLPSASLRLWRPARRATERAFAELDAVCAHVRDADGAKHVIMSAQGRAAAVAARWCGLRGRSDDRDMLSAPRPRAADALILYQPVWPTGARVRLDISCPVLVLSGPSSRSLRALRRPGEAVRLGGHVTCLQLPEYAALASPAGLAGVASGPASRAFFAELGRWLGTYMYGQPVDQLL